MIQNEKQAEITKRWIKDFKEALEYLEKTGDNGNPLKHELHTKATKSMIADLEGQLREYESTIK